MKENTIGTYFRRAMKIISWLLGVILVSVILTLIALQFPGVQRFIARKVVSLIAAKTHSRIEIGSIDIAFTHSVVLRDVFVEGRERDTLLSVKYLAVDVNLLGLLRHNISLKNVRVDSLTAHITRTLPDSSFNFQFILNALGGDATVKPHPDTTAGPGWDLRLAGLALHGIDVTYRDAVSGIDLALRLGSLEATIDKFDLNKKQFHVGKFSLENTKVGVTQTTESTPDTSPSPAVDFAVGTVSLANIQLSYENKVAGERYRIDLGTSALAANSIDLPARRVALSKFFLENTTITVVRPAKSGDKAERSDAGSLPWVVSVDLLNLSGNSVRYDVSGEKATGGMDPNHLRLDGLTMQAENIHFGDNRIAADIKHTSFREHSGFEIRELSGGVVVDSLHAQLMDFTLETALSRIRQSILLRYSSLSALRNLPGNAYVKATIGDSHIGLSDVLFFRRSLPIRNTPGSTVRFSARLSGLVRDLQVEELRVSAGDSTRIDLTGSVRGLPDVKTASYDINLRLFSSGLNDIRSLVADTLLPKNLVLPASIRMSGSFKGTTSDFSAASSISTSIGSLQGNVVLDSGPDARSARWNANVTVHEFNLGLLLNDTTTFGPVSMKGFAAGKGLKKENIEAQLTADVDKVVLNGYPYRRLTLSGTAGPKMFEGKAEIQDSNIAFTFDGTVNTSEEKPEYKFRLDLKGADLQQLHLTPDDMRVSGILTSDLTGRDLNDINGNIDARKVVIIKNRRRYLIDSLLFISVNNDSGNHFGVESTMLTAKFDGTIALGDLAAAVKEHFIRYFALHNMPVEKAKKAQAFTFQVSLRDPRTFADLFLPQVDRLSAGTIEGNYDSEKMILNLNIGISTVSYAGFDIDSVSLKVNSDRQRLQSVARIGSMADSMLHVTNLELHATVEHDSIDMTLQSTGIKGETKMLLAGVCNSTSDGYQFRFRPDGVIFQDARWDVPADNSILFGPRLFVVHDVVLRGAGQTLSLNSADMKSRQPPLKMEFSDFELATLSRIVERDSGLVLGVLNGNVVLQNLDRQMAFTSDLKVKDFAFFRKRVGDVVVRANNQNENVYELNMNITGNDNDVALEGKYVSKQGGSEIDLRIDFHKMNLASIEPFAFGSVHRLSGQMSGVLHITGTVKKPSINGNMKFNNAACTPTMLDSYLRVNNGDIVFDGNGVHFGSFELTDTLGNIASLSGNLSTEDFRDFKYDFRLHTADFLLMNKAASRDASYYGIVFLDSDILVGGDRTRPVIRMQAKLDKGSNLTVVLPEAQTAVEQRRGIVRFVDVKNPANPILSRTRVRNGGNRDTTRRGPSTIDLTSNVEVDKDSRLRILIDPIAGDSLVIRGDATFSVGVDPSGKLAVTGRYEIVDGSYLLSFGDFIRRQFAIEKGSSLSWYGSATDANVDITAVYTTKASVLDLVQDQLVGLSQEEKNKYKQQLPIQVYLKMDGKLLEPNIHFRLDLPPDQRGALGGTIYAKLNEINGQESELNKQVFALLVLGRFLSSNPLVSAVEGGGLSGIARSSVSQILSEQLNRLSEKFITGVNLNVGVESYQDYSTGNAQDRTQLQLALSKQLFDERVTVQVGGNVDLEGQRSQQNSLNNFAGDIKVGYKMTEDGRWQLQVFRQNTNAGPIEGDLIETGAGIVFTIDYDKLFGLGLTPVPPKEEEK